MKLGPLLIQNVEHVGLTSHGVLACIAGRTTEEHHLLFGHDGDSVAEARLRDLTVDLDVLDRATRHFISGAIIAGCGLLTVHLHVAAKARRLVLVLALAQGYGQGRILLLGRGGRGSRLGCTCALLGVLWI